MKKFLLVLSLFIYFSLNVNAQTNIWNDINESQIKLVSERVIVPESYRVLELNKDNLRILFESAPIEFSSESETNPSLVSLPMPDGSTENFFFWESPTMAPELQKQFPEIRTYTGQGIDDRAATLKMDLTPLGFHAMILSPNGRVFIDPYDRGNTQYYISYYTSDYIKKGASLDCELFIEEGKLEELTTLRQNVVLTPTGSQLRTYRLCVAATGEYTIYHGGTVIAGQAAVVTSVNRVNGVYEKEVAVRMVLIANNSSVIYTNSSTDPYSNNNGSAMLSQNISNLNSVIGSANYDIGHVFSTGGGGVAYLGCVCTSSKAGGVTGSSAPVGDPFDIDYVAHEIGHQFGGNHSFNGTTGSCSGGNRNSSTAYEPGSGSTIMAYAGICSPQDLQPHSDAYFHSVNFDEIVLYTNSGSGSSCPTTTSTGNNAPIVTVPTGGFYIPKSTPFALTGSATDPNGDAMTYCWEEYDLGPAGAPGTPSGDAPIFRSWNPNTSPTRTIPRLSDLLNNTSVIGELLPTYTRNLKFRMTVRDNHAGGGGVDRAQVNFAVDGNSGPFVVTSPNTNVSWTGNTTQTITWNVANTTASPVNCANVRILLSTNGGNTFPTVILASTPNDGSQVVNLPNLPTSQARIKVEAVGNIFFDLSNVDFTIINNPGLSDPVSFIAEPISSSIINFTFTPNAGNNNVIIVWNSTGTFTTPSGPPPAVGNNFAGGTLLYNGISSPQTQTGLLSGTNYFYKAFSYDGSTYSTGLISNAATFAIDNPSSFGAGAISSTEIFAGFATNIVGDNVVIVWNNTGTFTVPSGSPPAIGNPFSGGTLLYMGISSPQLHSGLIPATNYYYKAYSYDGTNYSSGRTGNATTLNVPNTFQLSVAINNGWNMVSIPGLHPTNQNVTTWWLGKDPASNVFRFNAGYLSVTTATPSVGYYMKNIGTQVYNTGDEWPAGGINIVPHDPINCGSGWNLIGVYECPVVVSGITANPPGIIQSSFFGYSFGYQVVDTLYPGYGYWIKLAGGQLIVPPCSTIFASSKSALLINRDWGKIIITDNLGKQYSLFSVNSKTDLSYYELPPAPLEDMFDVRYGSGRYAEDLSSGIQTIQMQGIEYPVKVRVENINIRLQDASGSGLNERLKSGEEVTISNSAISKLMVSSDLIPVEYALEQNYPNPFNPSTMISFSIPQRTQLKINLYNVLGEYIETLAEGLFEPGIYQTQFDAKNLPSGIYIYRMESTESSVSKKMILIR
ncbi:MAG: T9SS type A sorting domain-containing protein [Ignavibacteriaceae bacterium]|nr:T9SS type A sorting domain-containing protein [Ignavibacteriaceae bacterium]HRP94014.1 M12 family metallo-peptidase [Ignavibacteriaceae bacterium]